MAYSAAKMKAECCRCRPPKREPVDRSCTRSSVASNSIQSTVLAMTLAKMQCTQHYFQVQLQAVLGSGGYSPAFTAKTWIRSQTIPCCICGEQSGKGTGFYIDVLRYSPANFIPPMMHRTHSVMLHRRYINVAVDSVFKLYTLKCPKSEDRLSCTFIKCARVSRVNTWSRALQICNHLHVPACTYRLRLFCEDKLTAVTSFVMSWRTANLSFCCFSFALRMWRLLC